MPTIVKREAYLDMIRPYMGQPLIKVITGIRRCGKSTMFSQIMTELSETGVPDERIIRIDFDNMDNNSLRDGAALHGLIVGRMSGEGMHYVFIDEIQEVSGWERVANSLLSRGNIDLYISGSNSRLLSSELATYITGRYVSLEIQTLSFREYIDFRKTFANDGSEDRRKALDGYIRRGGFPLANISDYDDASADRIVRDIFESVFFRDTIDRNRIRNRVQIENLVKFMFDNIGNPFSVDSIRREFSRHGMPIDAATAASHLRAMEGSYLIRRVSRYNIRGKKVIMSDDKYYVADVSLIYSLMGFKNSMMSGIEENIVLLELVRRGYGVYVGRTKSGKEVDFVAERDGRKIYVQVTHTMHDEAVAERELSALKDIGDNYPKYVVTMDKVWSEDVDGIKLVSLADFLLEE
ncbi:MAG: ATP-binding protein [Candidatus Methanoplasma sp.]|nr:ATP-binding protein [Candidatus Methanoplasma sp.]